MKLFETPVVEVIKFSVQDVITVSSEEDDPFGDMTFMDPTSCAGG